MATTTLMTLKNFMSVPGHPCTTTELKNLSKPERDELLAMLNEELNKNN